MNNRRRRLRRQIKSPAEQQGAGTEVRSENKLQRLHGDLLSR